jgi:flagellar motor component MotA
MSESRIRLLATAREETVLSELERRYDLMRIALMDIAQGENPRKSMAKMAARFPRCPLTEQRALSLAHELLKLMSEREAVQDRYFDVSHRQQDDKLMVTLLFYVLLARQQGKDACQPYLPVITSTYFVDGLALVIDGMDAPFVRKWLREHKMVLLRDVQDKMRMSTELCLGIRDRLDYEDVFRIARSWMR